MAVEKLGSEGEIRALMKQWAEAVRRKDIEALMAPYAPDLISFDAWGELRNDVAVYRDHWEQCFAGHEGAIGFEHHELKLTVGDRVAFASFLIHMTGTLKNGMANDFWGRGTVGFEKVDDRWMVVHEHASVPFDPHTGQVCTNLKP